MERKGSTQHTARVHFALPNVKTTKATLRGLHQCFKYLLILACIINIIHNCEVPNRTITLNIGWCTTITLNIFGESITKKWNIMQCFSPKSPDRLAHSPDRLTHKPDMTYIWEKEMKLGRVVVSSCLHWLISPSQTATAQQRS